MADEADDSIRAWLDKLKQGWSAKFGGAFEEVRTWQLEARLPPFSLSPLFNRPAISAPLSFVLTLVRARLCPTMLLLLVRFSCLSAGRGGRRGPAIRGRFVGRAGGGVEEGGLQDSTAEENT